MIAYVYEFIINLLITPVDTALSYGSQCYYGPLASIGPTPIYKPTDIYVAVIMCWYYSSLICSGIRPRINLAIALGAVINPEDILPTIICKEIL